jgi:hypothetical protein
MTDLRPVGQSVKVCVGLCGLGYRVRLRGDRRARAGGYKEMSSILAEQYRPRK